jgi:murein DD-endopeptidase MepM/ murein hydrolase activator NlpD
LAEDSALEYQERVMTEQPEWLNPVEGYISSLGGLRTNPITGKSEFHDGIDIACPVGTKVVAVRDGTVLAAGWSASFGYYVKICFGDDYTAMYAHLDRLLVSPREKVAQGQQVAYSGNTGRSTGPHLHYSVFNKGQYTDPLSKVSLSVRDGLYVLALADGYD